jgi:hypothetical protein
VASSNGALECVKALLIAKAIVDDENFDGYEGWLRPLCSLDRTWARAVNGAAQYSKAFRCRSPRATWGVARVLQEFSFRIIVGFVSDGLVQSLPDRA